MIQDARFKHEKSGEAANDKAILFHCHLTIADVVSPLKGAPVHLGLGDDVVYNLGLEGQGVCFPCVIKAFFFFCHN